MAKRYATTLTTPTGERIYVSGRTKEELEKKKSQIRSDVRLGYTEPFQTATFREYARLWLRVYKSPPKIRESSFSIVQYNTERYVIGFFGDSRLQDITPLQIQFFLRSISHLSKSVQTKCLGIVKSIFETAVDNHLISSSPVSRKDRPAGAATEEKQVLTNEQAKQLIDHVAGTRAYLFCLIALSTGMRRGEILGLMWKDVDLEHRVIHVRHNKAFLINKNDAPVTDLLKTDCSRRELPIGDLLYEALKKEAAVSRSLYVLHMKNGESLTKGSFRALWEQVNPRPKAGAGEADPGLGFSVHPHLLRHTYCTQCIEGGMDIKTVQYLMGHATPEMTLRVYSHYRRKSRALETAMGVQRVLNYLGSGGHDIAPDASSAASNAH